MGKGSTTIEQPEEFNAAKAQGEFLFGKGFGDFQGITDPRLQQKLIASEREFGPQFLETGLQNINTFAKGTDQTGGYFDLLKDQSQLSGDLQRDELFKQRASDLGAIQDFSGDIVSAFRAADPATTALAETASSRFGQDTGIGALGQRLIGSNLGEAGAEEIAIRERGLADIDSDVIAASEAEQQLQSMGMSQGDLSPTEQEALISGRGTEFIQSTGELTPLEKRRAQQSARQSSISRGRGMDQSASYGEMAARIAEETGKRDREIALGSALLGQEASMRGSRLSQGAGMLTSSEALAAQRRAEQLQRQTFGTQALGASSSLAAQRRAELLKQQQLGAGFLGAEEAIQSGRLGQAYTMNRNIAGDLGSTILSRPSSAIQLGQSVLGSATSGAQGFMGPQLFDSNAGINLGLQSRAQDIEFQAAQAEANASKSSGLMGAIGTIGGGLLGGGFGSALGDKIFGD